MGLLDVFRRLRGGDTPQTSGAAKAAAGRSDLAEAAEALDELRGDNVSAEGAADLGPGGDKIANIVEAAKDVGIANMGGEAKIIGESDEYRSSK